jgi:hypothetical protein
MKHTVCRLTHWHNFTVARSPSVWTTLDILTDVTLNWTAVLTESSLGKGYGIFIRTILDNFEALFSKILINYINAYYAHKIE